jgi:hypothetical protein
MIGAILTKNFGFYMYTTDARQADGQPMDSRYRRAQLFHQAIFDTLLEKKTDKEKKNIKKMVVFEGSFFFSTMAIEGLEAEKLPLLLFTSVEQETFTVNRVHRFKRPSSMRPGLRQPIMGTNLQLDCRCASCAGRFVNTQALLQHCRDSGHMPLYTDNDDDSLEPDNELFLQFCNCFLGKALAGKLTKWGSEFIHPDHYSEPPPDRDGSSMGVTVYRAYKCDFGLVRSKNRSGRVSHTVLTLTVDLCAKIMRKTTVLDAIYDGRNPVPLSPEQARKHMQEWQGRTVIYKLDKKCYCVVALRFDLCPDNHIVQGLGVTHTEYFSQRKRITLEHPTAFMVEVLGRRRESIFFPAELVCGNELDSRIREKLPMIASYNPEKRHAAVDEILKFLGVGSAGDTLALCGILLQTDATTGKAKTLNAPATVLSLPQLIVAGVRVPPERKDDWGPVLKGANFDIVPNQANQLNVVIVYNQAIGPATVKSIYKKLMYFVNSFNSTYRFPEEPAVTIKCSGTMCLELYRLCPASFAPSSIAIASDVCRGS